MGSHRDPRGADSEGNVVMGQSGDSPSAFVYVDFSAQIKLNRAEMDEASGDLAQAVQNRIGHTGALVIDIDAEEERDD